MEIQFVIVRSENAEYLCHNVNGTYVRGIKRNAIN